MDAHALPGQESAQRLREGERGGLGDRVGRDDRQRCEGVQRQVVHDGSPGSNQQRQESLGHAIGAEQVDGEVAFECGTITEVVVKCQAGVIDEEIERPDSSGRRLYLCRAGHVQGQRRDAAIRVGQGLARAGVHPLRASAQGFPDQRLPDAPVGPGDQDCLAFDCHNILLIDADLRPSADCGSPAVPICVCSSDPGS
jgi:hypothetical protein